MGSQCRRQPDITLIDLFRAADLAHLEDIHENICDYLVYCQLPLFRSKVFVTPAKPHYFLLPLYHKISLCLCLLPDQACAWTFYLLTVNDKMGLSCARR